NFNSTNFRMENLPMSKRPRIATDQEESVQSTMNHEPIEGSCESSQDEKILSEIEQLPNELLWLILDDVSESVLSLRLASRHLKSRVDKYAFQHSGLPITESLAIEDDEDSSFTSLCLVLKFHPEKASLFKLRLKVGNPSEDLSRSLKRVHEEEGHFISYLFFSIFDLHPNDENMMDCLIESIGTRIRKELLSLNQKIWQAVSKLIEGKTIDKLSISTQLLSDVAADYLLQMIKKHTIYHLTLEVSMVNISSSDPKKLLLELSAHLQSLTIIQDYAKGVGGSRKYLFGLEDSNWADIIFEMLDSKLDKLYIYNRYYQGYLSKKEGDILQQKLPMLDKKIWFSATCNAYNILCSYPKNGHLIETGFAEDVLIMENRYPKPKTKPKCLRIRHTTRQKEPFEI
ncbi:hypothetical protein PMAYCL1PPCAC_19275, partial [Pristionchus mayeri]